MIVIKVVETWNNSEDDADHDLYDVACDKLRCWWWGWWQALSWGPGMIVKMMLIYGIKTKGLWWRCQCWCSLWWRPEMRLIIYTSGICCIITSMCITAQCSKHRVPHLSNGERIHSSDCLLGRLSCYCLWGSGPLCRSTELWLHM